MRPLHDKAAGMKTFSGFALWLCLLAASLLPVCVSAAEPTATATIRQGTLEGSRKPSLEVFLGVPFAAPPVGALRWREPQAAVPWQGTRKADAYASSCMQKTGIPVAEGGTTGALSEDCLYLNVWTPKADSAKRPVMVWIHGGALVYGSGNIALYDGSALARRGAVVVTLNYRMGALGFFSHPAIDGSPASPVNYGLFDQVAALRWVRDNIAAFGGDPGNVTIFGESAGAQSVLALYSSPLARGLFKQGIAQSPYGISGHTRAHAREVSVKVATAVGVPGANAAAAQLRAVPASRFFELGDKGPTLAPGFIVGDAALPRSILEMFQENKQARLPLIIGSNSDEATVVTAFGVDPAMVVQKLRAGKFLLRQLYPGVTDESQLGREVVRDAIFTSFARRIATLHSQSAPTWRYYFSHVQQGLQGSDPGVGHGGEIPFVLGTGTSCLCLMVPFSTADSAYAQQVGDYWYAFASTGKPSAINAPAWRQDSVHDSRVLEFGSSTAPRKDFMKKRLEALLLILKTLDLFLRR
ncbi:MAG: carboxylesterase/lipase family protein [Pseudoxanthomonas sp.]